MESRIIPKFANEAEEAKWWYDHREEIADDILAASREGRLSEGIKVRWLRRQAEKQQQADLPAAKPLAHSRIS
jgi:hypothetical protein